MSLRINLALTKELKICQNIVIKNHNSCLMSLHPLEILIFERCLDGIMSKAATETYY